MGTPGFWDDQARAASVSTEHARATRKLERYESLRREVDEAAELLELEPELEAEVAEQVAPVREELARLQEEALFDGEYDAGDAVVTITAGAGGTDAQDWAEMLLRMYLRWTAARGFQTEVIEASPGEEAGLKSATVTVRGENAYGLFKAERGVRRLVRLSPFDSAHRRPLRSPRSWSRRCFRQCRGRDRRERPADRHVPRQRRRRPARQQDRFGRPDHPPAHGDRRAVPERAIADVQQADGDADPALASRRARGRSAKPSLRGSEAERSTSGSAARSAIASCAPVPAGQGSPHEPRGWKRAGRPRRRSRRLRAGLPARAGGRQGVSRSLPDVRAEEHPRDVARPGASLTGISLPSRPASGDPRAWPSGSGCRPPRRRCPMRRRRPRCSRRRRPSRCR